MSSRTQAISITAVATAVNILRPWMKWDALPSLVAGHFGPDGSPSNFTEKTQFFFGYGLLMGLVLISLLGSGALLDKLPAKFINLPHKEYWLKEGRLDEAREKLTSAMWWMTAATMTLSAGVMELILEANVRRGSMNEGILWAFIGGYLLFSLVWTVKLLTAFTPPDSR